MRLPFAKANMMPPGEGHWTPGASRMPQLLIVLLCCCFIIALQSPGIGAVCGAGWTGDDCKTDINECSASNDTCGQYSQCNNTPGSFSCACLKGFSGDGRTCTDIDECADGSAGCHPKASCSNQVGKFECTCGSGFYGNGTVCYEETMLPTTDATQVTQISIDGELFSDVIQSSTPFLVGQVESSIFRIFKGGFIAFSNKSLPGYWYYPQSPYLVTIPMVMPYWTITEEIPHRRRRRRSSLSSRSFTTTTVNYELLDAATSGHAARPNWRRVRQIVERFVGTRFEPSTALIVTWKLRINRMPRTTELDCYSSCSNAYRVRQARGWESLCRKWCQEMEAKAGLEFQAVVTRNKTHSYAVFNYGRFQLPMVRLFPKQFDYFYTLNLRAVAGFTDGYSTGDELPFSRENEWPEQHNLLLGNTGRHGRHVMQLSSWYSPSSQASRCRNWITEAPRTPTSSSCSNCPFDFRTAVLDRRYSAYEFDCTGASIFMCFTSSSYDCAGNFTTGSCGSADSSWLCDRRRCQFLMAPRCCYRMRVAAGSKLHQLCSTGLSLWSVRGQMRRIMFDMPPTGYLVSLASEGAGHAALFVRDSIDDEQLWWFDDTQQYRREAYGREVCREAGMMAKFAKVRPICTSRDYKPPAGGFQRGDPHLSNLGNMSYTFNGHCEYHLLMSQSSRSPPLWLQARTSPVRPVGAGGSSPSSGGGATAFVAVALKSGTNSMAVAVVRNDSTDDMDVVVVGGDGRRLGSVRGDLVARDNATTLGSYRIEAIDNRSVSVADEFAGVSVTVAMETHSLQASVQVDADKFPDGLDGLLGNSRASGFKMRNGTFLPAGSSERRLFQFGNSWRLTDTDQSHLPYPPGRGRADFCDLSFVPTFAEDFKTNAAGMFGGNAELRSAAETECRKSGGGAYLSCMFDAAQLRSLAAARDAASAASAETTARATLANRPPGFVGAPDRIRVNGENGSVEATFRVVDPDGGEPELLVDEATGGVALLQSDGGSGTRLTWRSTPSSRQSRLRLLATDADGGTAAWTPTIELCQCANGGTCCEDCGIDLRGPSSFYRLKCRCPPGFTGDGCEKPLKACTENCSDGDGDSGGAGGGGGGGDGDSGGSPSHATSLRAAGSAIVGGALATLAAVAVAVVG